MGRDRSPNHPLNSPISLIGRTQRSGAAARFMRQIDETGSINQRATRVRASDRRRRRRRFFALAPRAARPAERIAPVPAAEPW